MPEETNLPALPKSVANMPVLIQDVESIIAVLQENSGASKMSARDLDKIKVPGADNPMFVVQGLNGPQGYAELEGVVCLVQSGRAFWISDDGDNNPPNCTSENTIHGFGRRGDTDDHDGPHDCASCAMNQFGSAMKEGKPQAGKACNERAHLFFLMGTSFLPQIVQVPGTSLQNWSKYITRLSSFGVRYTAVVTKLALNVKKSRGGKSFCEIVFNAGGELPLEAATRVRRYADVMEDSFRKSVREDAAGGPQGDAHDTPPPPGDGDGPSFDGPEQEA